MVVRLNAYLYFSGNCREALEFYRDCLGGELNLMTMGESPMASQMPPEARNRVMHCSLVSGDMIIMASDTMQPGELIQGNTVSLCISGTNKKEIETYFSKLSGGGKITQPLETMFFGTYGALTDKFGINWMFQIDAPQT